MDRLETPLGTNNLMGLYSYLGGSHGQVCLHLSRGLLEKISALLESRFKDDLEEILIAPSGEDRFRIRAALSNTYATWFGQGFLYILSQDGIEIGIEQSCAYPKKPFRGSLVTTLFGKTIIPQLVRSINQALGAGKVLQMSSEVFRTTTYITLAPFPLLQKFLPLGMGNDITRAEWRTNHESFVFTFDWYHSGRPLQTALGNSGGKLMDQQMQTFVDNLVNSQFAELRGSWANLHLVLTEKLLNEAVKALTSEKGPNANKWLALVEAVQVKGAISVDLKLKV